jgi:diadenosine tetraphosphate (Ap4A) HIT family hydrolase
MNDCYLCEGVNQDYRVVERNESVYSMIPIAPLVEGHVMILPRRHIKMEQLEAKEHIELSKILCKLKDKLVKLYHPKDPIISTLSDTIHASIPEHFHYHIFPSEVNMRGLMSAYDANIPENERLNESELERMAVMLR